jgi:4-hydroxybenzoate polyprenyltransferase
MKIIKILLLLLAIGVGAYILLWLFGIIASLLWYVFWIGLIAIGAGVGYKLFLSGGKEDTPQLEEKKPTAVSELENADRALEEYRKKYLNE